MCSQDLEAPQQCSVGIFVLTEVTGVLIRFLAAMGGSYAFVRTASANLRRTNDPYNEMFGGLVAGAIAGMRSALLDLTLLS